MAFIFAAPASLSSRHSAIFPHHFRSSLFAPPRPRTAPSFTCTLLDDTTSYDANVPEITDESSSDLEHSVQQVSRLRSEHLNAFFDADESMYQVRLANVFSLALKNFVVELGELQTGFSRLVGLDSPLRYTPPDCLNFILDDAAVANRERERENRDGRLETGWFVRKVYDVTCTGLDFLFDGRPIPRFWMLETVARMPYFAYSSCLHLLSTLGWYRSPTLMNMHHAEELNEAYHLAVMESLGGDKRWRDRFLAFHASLVYYWYVKHESLSGYVEFASSALKTHTDKILEAHAADSYCEFIDANRDLLRSLPAPEVSHEYYSEFMYYFYEFQLSDEKQSPPERRPEIFSLLDVFENILLDEREHTRTMSACIDFIENGNKFHYNGKAVSGSSRRPNVIPSQKREQFWRKWAGVHKKRDRG